MSRAHLAAALGDDTAIATLNVEEINSTFHPLRCAPTHVACAHDQSAVVAALLRHPGMDPSIIDAAGDTPLLGAL